VAIGRDDIELVKKAYDKKREWDRRAVGADNRVRLVPASTFYWPHSIDADGVPILSRSFRLKGAILENKIHSPLGRSIINNKVNYFATNVALSFDGVGVDVEDYYTAGSLGWSMDKLYELLARDAVMVGSSYALYLEVEGKPWVSRVEPWRALVVRSEYTGAPLLGAIYDEKYFTVYNRESYQTFQRSGGGGWSIGDLIPGDDGEIPHSSPGSIPLVEFPNNIEKLGNYQRTVGPQDYYDLCMSDLSTELTQDRLSYLFLKGMGVSETDESLQKKLKESRVLVTDDEMASVHFVQKKLDFESVNLFKTEIRKNIFDGASSFDPGNFSDGKTPPSAAEINQRLFPLETDTAMTIQLWRESFGYLDDVIMRGSSYDYDPRGIVREFRKQSPTSGLGEVVLANTAGITLSNETKIKLSGLPIDSEEEQRKLEKEKDVRGDEAL
jgi:hypothetical protein